MGVVIRRNFSLANLQIVTRAQMQEIGLLLRERIVRRTMAGQDAEGQPFAAYSPDYAKRKGEALGTDAVNLSVSGEMLNNLAVVDVTDRSVTLGFRR